MTWLRNGVRQQYPDCPASPSFDDIALLAQDRDRWCKRGKSHLQFLASNERYSYLHPCQLHRWHDFVTQHVSWAVVCALLFSEDAWYLKEEGVRVLNVTLEHSFSLDVVLSVVPYIRMQYPALVLQIGILPLHYDAHITQFDGFGDRLMKEHNMVAPSSNETSCLTQVTGESLSQQRLLRLDAKGFRGLCMRAQTLEFKA